MQIVLDPLFVSLIIIMFISYTVLFTVIILTVQYLIAITDLAFSLLLAIAVPKLTHCTNVNDSPEKDIRGLSGATFSSHRGEEQATKQLCEFLQGRTANEQQR